MADTHFNHRMLVEGGHRPEGFEECIFSGWAQVVKPDDLLIHLGDVAIPDAPSTGIWERIQSMPGRKVLVMGNHDQRSAKWYMEHGFAFACEAFQLGRVLFTHRPAICIHEHIRLNIHGHLHSGEHRPAAMSERCRLISMELNGYYPVAVDKIN